MQLLSERGAGSEAVSTPSWSGLDVGIVGFGSTICFLSGLKEPAHIRYCVPSILPLLVSSKNLPLLLETAAA